ncbi:hypothetical protein [Chromobacterium paludis]|uniref:Transcriptional regulator n=1 Tax=Chromobacterium paludis TaxID=2605945 RepID=A0A5C1DFG4_9NEIS|nr:hypothetical protein [Chromobacterium paludis]QEL55471.1 hypothetical protein FYK34_07790 [Chromobacterium paludis]
MVELRQTRRPGAAIPIPTLAQLFHSIPAASKLMPCARMEDLDTSRMAQVAKAMRGAPFTSLDVAYKLGLSQGVAHELVSMMVTSGLARRLAFSIQKRRAYRVRARS